MPTPAVSEPSMPTRVRGPGEMEAFVCAPWAREKPSKGHCDTSTSLIDNDTGRRTQ